MHNSIVLASQSPRRKQLLEWAEIPFEIIVKETDEQYPDGLEVEQIPVFIARNKALEVQKFFSSQIAGRPILAADTVVVLNNEIIGKPTSVEHAIDTIGRLANTKHEVITGVVILFKEKEYSFFNKTEVWFHPLTKEQIEFYVYKYKPFDKAGAYAIQEWIGVTGIKQINGDFYNVMGLPISRVVQQLSLLK